MDPRSPRTFRILGRFGQGRYGPVYLARPIGSTFAQDVVLELVDSPDPAWLSAVTDRARLIARSREPVLLGEEPPLYLGFDRWALVREMVEGCTLERLLQESVEVPVDVALEIVRRIGEGLRRTGLTHGQLRASSIGLGREGEVKLEGAGAHPQASPTADVRALGEILLQMLERAPASDPRLGTARRLADELRSGSASLRDVGPDCRTLLGSDPVPMAGFAARVAGIAAPEITPDVLTGTDFEEQPVPAAGSEDLETQPFPDDSEPLRPPGYDPEAETVPEPELVAPAPLDPALATSLPDYLDAISDPGPGPEPVPAAEPPPPPRAGRAGLVVLGLGVAAVGGLGVGGVFLGGVVLFLSLRTAPEEQAAPAAPDPEPSLTEGFAVSSPKPGRPPIEPLRDAPDAPPDLEPSEATPKRIEPDIEVGLGRAAVLRLDVRPQAFRITPHLELTALPPYLVISASRGGLFTLTVEHEGGEREWAVSVHGTGEADPSGASLAAVAERLALDVGEGALCTLERPADTVVIVDPSGIAVEALDDRTYYLQPESSGVVDVVFGSGSDTPRVVTVDATDGEGTDLPEGCSRAETDFLSLPVGAEVTVPIGVVASIVHVGDSSVALASTAEDEPRGLTIRAAGRGRTSIAVSDGRGGRWLRRIVVE